MEVPQSSSSNEPSSDTGGSLLDRVIESQQAASVEQFHPTDLVSQLFHGLSEKEEDVLQRRFGLGTAKPETLEDIGKHYGVTRERIRQIQVGAVKRITKAKGFRAARAPLEQLTVGILTAAGGAVEEEHLVRETLAFAGATTVHRRALQFLLTQLLDDRLAYRPASSAFHPSWALAHTTDDLAAAFVANAVQYFEKRGTPASQDELLAAARAWPSVTANPERATTAMVLAQLARSVHVAVNPFGDWGLAQWGSIVPKRINDKISLVLTKAGEPLHFTEIAKRINDAGFDTRTAYAPTVHNELILNPHYVLVGRGLYALKSWGYREGVVADVIAEVLKVHGDPMKRTDLVAEVLKQRFVKRNTVQLALSDRERFERLPDGTYRLRGRAA